MKSLYESILDDENILINDVKKDLNWENIVYNILIRNTNSNNQNTMRDVCMEYLNANVNFVKNKNAKWYKEQPIYKGFTKITYGIDGYNGIDLMSFEAHGGWKQLYVRFLPIEKPTSKKVGLKYEEKLRSEFNMSKQDYLNFKQDMIKTFKLERAKEFSGECWKSNLK
jgi:hypothetical protein